MLLPSVLYAQSTRVLTLEECLRLARSGSPAAEIARLQFAQAEADLRAFRGSTLPSLAFSSNVPSLQREIIEVVQDDGSIRFVEQSRTFSTAGLTLDQALPWTGGRVSVSSGLSRVEEFGDFDRLVWQSTPISVSLTQPLFQFNPLRWEQRLAPLRFQASRRALVEDLEQTALDAAGLFFDVYLAEIGQDIAAFNLAVNDTIYTLSQGRFDIGRIAENDLLQSELALLNAQTALAQAEIQADRARQALKTALRLPTTAPLEVVPPLTFPEVDIDPGLAVEQAQRYRAAILDAEVRALQADRAVAEARRGAGPSATLQASYGLNQSAGAFDAVYDSPLNQQRATLRLQVPIMQWGQGQAERAAAEAARAETTQRLAVERDQLEQDVYFEALQFRQLQQQVRIAAKADTVAARRFEVARSRYRIGTIDITDLFDAQREQDAARRAYVSTLRDYWTSYYRLRRLTLYDFVRGEPIRLQ
ncbi:MAG: TolC family protein [Bacteroidota bacterium]